MRNFIFDSALVPDALIQLNVRCVVYPVAHGSVPPLDQVETVTTIAIVINTTPP